MATYINLLLVPGGGQTPYKDADFTMSLQTHKQYTCGANFFWVNHLYAPSAGVPIRAEAVRHLMATVFPEPALFNPLEYWAPWERIGQPWCA